MLYVNSSYSISAYYATAQFSQARERDKLSRNLHVAQIERGTV